MTTEPTFTAEGGCACGEVRYRLERPPFFVNCCHCRYCQRETGAAFALNASIESNAITLLGNAPEAVDIPTMSGKGQRIMRCANCRIALWGNYLALGEAVSFVRVGTLDEPDRLPPDLHLFTESKQPWVTLPKTARTAERYYNRQKYWPESSLKRWHALFD